MTIVLKKWEDALVQVQVVIISLRNFGQLCLVISCPAPDVAGPTHRFIQMRNVPDQHCLPWDTKVPCITFYGPGCWRTKYQWKSLWQHSNKVQHQHWRLPKARTDRACRGDQRTSVWLTLSSKQWPNPPQGRARLLHTVQCTVHKLLHTAHSTNTSCCTLYSDNTLVAAQSTVQIHWLLHIALCTVHL